MRIALVSYEFAGVAAGGGIGTYVRNAAAMLAARGHDVEVFTSGDKDGWSPLQPGARINTVAAERHVFAKAVLPAFSERHASQSFDLVEGAEYGADAEAVAEAFPALPLVVKLHTPTYMIDEMANSYLTPSRKARFVVGAWRRGRAPRPFWRYRPDQDPERRHARTADEITAPAADLLQRVGRAWDLPIARLSHVPNVFVPSADYLEQDPDTLTNRVTYLGRLEARKGVLELAHAIPKVMARAPQARFRLIGRSLPHPSSGEDMAAVIARIVGRWLPSVEFVAATPHAEIPGLLGETDICVFPSLWEASPFVCKEAMAAARGVIGSSAGGMTEIIEHGRTGLLVPPRDPDAIAAAILDLLQSPARRMQMGRAARADVSAAYAPEIVAPIQEASYRRAMARALLRDARPCT